MRTAIIARSAGNAKQSFRNAAARCSEARAGQRRKEFHSNNNTVRSSYIVFITTVNIRSPRQLEAIIRISESLAKLTLSPVVQNHHVEEAIRLFKYSTMDAVTSGSADGLSRGELNEEMSRIERELRRRLPVGWSTSYQSLVREFVTQQGYSSHALERTLYVLEKKEVIRFSGQVSGAFSRVLMIIYGNFARKKWCIGTAYLTFF